MFIKVHEQRWDIEYFINTNQIVELHGDGCRGTYIETSNGEQIECKETPAEIMAMIEGK